MSDSKIKPEAIKLLCQILKLPKEVIIYDPKEIIQECNLCIVNDVTTLLRKAQEYKVCVNVSDQNLEVLSFSYILEFNSTRRNYHSFFGTQFLNIKNPDGTIRWFLPAKSKHPNFLELYNGTGFKAEVFNLVARIAFQINFKKWFCQGCFCLYSKEENYIQNKFGSRELAFFTGTVGENRKAVAALCKNGKATHFIKIPISKKAEKLIRVEEHHLHHLNKYDFEKLSLPIAELNDVGLRLTNIRPPTSLSFVTINTLQLQALKDLYANTFQVKLLKNVDSFRVVKKNLSEIKTTKRKPSSNLSSRKIERLTYNLNLLLNTFDEDQLIPVAYAHGDFTPWNMFVNENRVYTYDWELAMPEQLFLYDAFHFVFQSDILILQQPFVSIKKKIERLKKDPIVADLIERYRLDYWDCYRWYLISNCSYYLNLYLKQETLHKQAFWLIDCWVTATNDAIKQNKNKVVQLD